MPVTELNGKEKKKFRDALCSAFENESELNELTNITFNKNLNFLVKQNSYELQVFELIGKVISMGYLEDFMRDAVAERPNNPALREFVSQYIRITEPKNPANTKTTTTNTATELRKKYVSLSGKKDINFDARAELAEVEKEIERLTK